MKRVLGFIPPGFTPLAYWRFTMPFRYLAPFGFELRTLGETVEAERWNGGFRIVPDLLDGIDAVLFPQVIWEPGLAQGIDPYPLVEEFCNEADRRGVRIVYAPDDWVYDIEPANPAYDGVARNWPLVDLLRARCHALIVSTPGLAERFANDGRPIHVLPNVGEATRWRRRPRTSGEWRIGWGGSGAHADNLLMVMPAIRRLTARHPVRFIVQGLTAEPLQQLAQTVLREVESYTPAAREAGMRFVRLARELRDAGGTHEPYCPPEEYFDRLPALDLDIGICPLRDTSFNRCKSAVKYIEYALSGTLTIASDVAPYAGEVSITVPNDEQSWYDVLEHWIRRPAERDAELERQRAFVLEERNIERACVDWARVLDSILA